MKIHCQTKTILSAWRQVLLLALCALLPIGCETTQSAAPSPAAATPPSAPAKAKPTVAKPDKKPAAKPAKKPAAKPAKKPVGKSAKTPAAKPAKPAVTSANKANEGFEAARGWTVPQWNLGAKVSEADNPDEAGNVVAKVAFAKDVGEKAVVSLVFRRAKDLSKAKAIALDLFNPNKTPVKVAIALNTKGDFVWHESEPLSVAAGKWGKNLSIPLQVSKFKTEATKWKATAPIKGLENINALFVLVFPQGEGHVLLDNIRLVPAE